MSDYSFILDIELYSNKQDKFIESLCKQLYDDIEKSIRLNVNIIQRDFSNNQGFSSLTPLKFDWTKCSQYKNFVKNDTYKLLTVKYKLSDINYPYNKNYEINWDINLGQLEIKLYDQ